MAEGPVPPLGILCAAGTEFQATSCSLPTTLFFKHLPNLLQAKASAN